MKRLFLILIFTGAGLLRAEDFPLSPGKSFLYSFIFPGAGQWYTGSKKSIWTFVGTEIGLWATFAGFRTYGHWKERDYHLYAVGHAGIDPHGKDRNYYLAIENYMDIVAYNDAKLQQRRPDLMYPEGTSFDWHWESETSRKRYERMRIKADQAYRNSLFVLGGILVNHVISGIDAVRCAKKRNAFLGMQFEFMGLPEGGFVGRVWATF